MSLEAVKALLKSNNCIIRAIIEHNCDLLRILHEAGIRWIFSDHITPLHLAAATKCHEVGKLLFAYYGNL